jgi:hypothetical protein
MPQYPDNLVDQIRMLDKRLSNVERNTLISGIATSDPADPPPATGTTNITGITSSITYRVNPFTGGLQAANINLDWDELIPPPGPTRVGNYVLAYEVQFRSTEVVTSTWSDTRTIDEAETSYLNMNLDTEYEFRIRAVTRRGFRGAWATHIVNTTFDATPPPQPSDPVLEAKLGGIRIAWDGLTISATAMPSDFSHVDVHVSLTNGFTPTNLTKVTEFTGPSYYFVPAISSTYVVHYVKFIAYDTTGNASVVSTQKSAVPQQVLGGDIANGEISYDEIAFKNQGNLIADGSFEVATWRSRIAAASFNAAWFVTTPVYTWGTTTANAFHGTAYLEANAALGSGSRAAILSDVVLLNGIAVEPNQKYLFRVAWWASAAAPGTANIDLRWVNNVGTAIAGGTVIVVTGNVSNGVWQTASVFTTAPAGATFCTPRITLNSAANSGTWRFDAMEMRRVVQTEIIDDLAVTNAKIADATIQNAKIATLDAGKINTGFLSADRIQLGTGMSVNLHPSPSFDSAPYRANYPAPAQFSYQSSGGFDGVWKLRGSGNGTGPTMVVLSVKAMRGDRFYIGCLQQTISPANGTMQMGGWAYDENGTFIANLNGALNVTADGVHLTWRKRQTVIGPCPHGTVTVQFFFHVATDSTAGSFEIDLLEIRNIVGTTTVNTITSRVEMTPVGIKMWDANSNQTVDIDANTGNVLVAGTIWSGLDLTKRRIKINPDTTNLAEIQFFAPNDIDFAFINSFTTGNNHAALGLNAEGTGDQSYSAIFTDQEILIGRMDGDTLTAEQPAIEMIGDQFGAGGLNRIFLLGRIPESAGGFNRTALMGGNVAGQVGTTGAIVSYGLSMVNDPKVVVTLVDVDFNTLADEWHLVEQSGTQFQTWQTPVVESGESISWVAILDND